MLSQTREEMFHIYMYKQPCIILFIIWHNDNNFDDHFPKISNDFP